MVVVGGLMFDWICTALE